MSAAIRDEVNRMMTEGRKLAHDTMSVPKSEREYMLAVGKYQQLFKDARALKERFLDPEAQVASNEDELPDDPDEEAEDSIPSRRVQPQTDRLTRARERHRPRQA